MIIPSIIAAFLAGMTFQAIRESRHPINSQDDDPALNGYVPAIEDVI